MTATNATLILTIIADDKPGLVQSVADIVSGHGGNWEESALARLGGKFAGIVEVAIPADGRAAFEAALGELGRSGITIAVHKAGETTETTGRIAQLSLTGIDHPGIVRDISSALAGAGVNIDELNSRLFPGSMSGEHMFTATARIVIPDGLSAEALGAHLEHLAQDIMVDIDLSPVPAYSV